MKFLISLLPAFYQRALAWRASQRKDIKGVLVRGDADAAPSTTNQLVMVFRRLGWKKVVVATVESGGDPFYVGYRTNTGQIFLCEHPLVGSGFRAKLGKEDVTFFALNPNGDEIPIINVIILTKEHAAQFADEEFPRV